MITANAEATNYMIGKSSTDFGRVIVRATADSAWVDIDFVKLFSDFTYTYFESPSRIVLTNEWKDITVSTLKGKTQVRFKGGIKSPILADVEKGDVLKLKSIGGNQHFTQPPARYTEPTLIKALDEIQKIIAKEGKKRIKKQHIQ